MKNIQHKQTKQQNNNHQIGRLLLKLPTLYNDTLTNMVTNTQGNRKLEHTILHSHLTYTCC